MFRNIFHSDSDSLIEYLAQIILQMGAVSSMCCETEKKSHLERTLPKPSKDKVEKPREIEIKKNTVN